MPENEIGFVLSEKAIRLLRAYSLFSGEGVAGEIHEAVSVFLEKELARRCRSILGADLGIQTDSTGISEGLGDEEPPEEERPHSVTDVELEHEMDVEDPAKEAKAIASPQLDLDLTGEEVFAREAGLPSIPAAPKKAVRKADAFVDHRILKRKKKPRGKGKATPITANEVS